nr:MAG TPA: hypothetical protein [Caudoviricetes sp.]
MVSNSLVILIVCVVPFSQRKPLNLKLSANH